VLYSCCLRHRQDEFQVKFWKLRQAEYSPYTLQYSPIVIRQGQLTDPLYFDFINYTQYALLAKEMPKGRQVFEEFCEIEEECPEDRKRVVRRDQALSDNKLLPSYMEVGIGDKMYSGLVNGFEVRCQSAREIAISRTWPNEYCVMKNIACAKCQ
jgi:hypothetical protein